MGILQEPFSSVFGHIVSCSAATSNKLNRQPDLVAPSTNLVFLWQYLARGMKKNLDFKDKKNNCLFIESR